MVRQRRSHRPGFRWRLAAAGLGLVGLVGCGNEDPDDDTLRDAEIYSSIVDDLANRSGMQPAADDLPVLFIEALDPDGISLTVQVEVVAELIEEYEVRFIDDRVEAIEVDLPGQPVRADSLLIGLGPIAVDGSPAAAEVRGELYLAEDDVSAYRYTVAAAPNGWEVAGEGPEPIDPEGFVPSS